MIEHIITTGDTGRLKIVDNTDNPGLMTAELWIQSLSPVSVPALPWTYSIDETISTWKSFNFVNTTVWQKLKDQYVGTSRTVTLHLGSTGTSQLNGPTNQTINLYGYVPPEPIVVVATVKVKVGSTYKTAIPYVRVNGVWTVAHPYIKTVNGWVT